MWMNKYTTQEDNEITQPKRRYYWYKKIRK